MRNRLLPLLFAGILISGPGMAQQITRYLQPVLSPSVSSGTTSVRGNIRALVVGVSHYQYKDFSDLLYARRDAEAFAAFLKTPAGGSVSGENLVLLTNEQATLARVSNALDWLSEESRKGDKIVVYCSVYGKAKGRKDAHLLFYDSPPSPVGAGSLSLSRLSDLLGDAASRNGARVLAAVEFHLFNAGKKNADRWKGTEKKGGLHGERLSAAPGALAADEADTTAKSRSYGNGLLYGLLGMADADYDEKVQGPELLRYLKQRGKKGDVAPGNCLYLAYPAKDDWLCKAPESTRGKLAEQAEGFFTPILQLEVQPLDDFMARNADAATRQRYEDFILTIRLGQLLLPPGRCAAALYDSLMQVEALEPVYSSLRRRMAVAYQDEAQQALNAYLRTSVEELARRRKNKEHYKLYSQYMQRTIELLGPKHFMLRQLQTKRLYFEGLALRLEAGHHADSPLLPAALAKQQEAVALEPEAAYVYNEMGVVSYLLNKYAVAENYFREAAEYSPTWSIPHSNLSLALLKQGRIKEAQETGLYAIGLSPWNPNTYVNLGEVYHSNGNLADAEKLYRRALAIDPALPDAHYDLARLLAQRKQYADALESLRKALESGFDDPNLLHADTDLKALHEKATFRELVAAYFPEYRKE